MIWKIPLAVVGTLAGVAVVALIAVACVLYVPSVRQKVLNKGLVIANEQTDYDIDLGSIYLSPFHHSPLVLYRAYKGKADLPLEVNIDSLYVGHRGQDTLIYVHALRLKATAKTANLQSPISNLQFPIEVDTLQLDRTTFHSDSMIAAVGIDAIVGHLAVRSPNLNIAKGQYPLHGLRLNDTYVGIDLRPTEPDTATNANDTTPMLMAFDVPDGELRNLRFVLTPIGLDIATRLLNTNVLADVGGNTYDARRIDIGRTRFAIGSFAMPIDTLYGDACVALNSNRITSSGLHVRADGMGAKADLSATEMNLETMRVDVTGDADFRGSKARLRGWYDIDDEAYDMHVNVEKVDLSSFLKDSTHVVLAGAIDAKGKGINPNSRAMKSKVKIDLTDAQYDNIDVSGMRLDAELADKTVDGTLHLPFAMSGDSLRVSAQTEHQFRVSDFMNMDRIGVDYHTQMRNVKAHVADKDFQAQQLNLDFATDSTTSLHLATDGLNADLSSPVHVMTLVNQAQQLSTVNSPYGASRSEELSTLDYIDSLCRLLPPVQAGLVLRPGSPIQSYIDSTRVLLDQVALNLSTTPEHTDASLTAEARVTDGAMSFYGLCTDAALRMDIERNGRDLHGNGRLTLDSINYNNSDLGSHAIDMRVAPSKTYDGALCAEVHTEEIPLALVNSFVELTDIDLKGAIRASAAVDGLPNKTDISAEVLPLNVSAEYTPYNVRLGLGETPIIMSHNHVDLNGLPVYGADSTFIALTGGLDLNSMRLDVVLEADSFAPAKLVKDGPIPVYGDLATDIHGTVTGPLDSIVADVDVTVLPTTDITYPIDKKNLAQVKPHGTVNVRYQMAEKDPLALGGQINVDDGFIRYSPKAYPIMPFHVDSGSHVAFNGPIGQTDLAISASQKVKADVESEGEETRRVDFTTGVRVNGKVDSIGLKSIGFFLEAPEDETITRELSSLDEETREGLAATLLATGMYVGESNVAAQRTGYAFSSIVNSRLNAAMSNSKLGKVVDIDISSAQTEHAGGKTNDMNIAISKSFFQDRFRITIGSTLTDNPEVNQASGLLTNVSAEYKLTKDGVVALRLFAQRDYHNILEGDLYKYGLGVRAKKEWRRLERYRTDSITRTYGLMADADIAWRSNNSLGPNLTLTSSIRNLMGRGETFTLKGNGAYYWALRGRHPGDPKKTDTYKLGATASLIFPYLHWAGDNNPEGDTRYMLGYQYENIAGGYGVHKVSGSLTYFIHSPRNPHVVHSFTPFSLSVVRLNAETDSLVNKAAEYPQLIKVLASPEFVPSIGYGFTFDDYRDKRAVNTMLELGVKESGNLINAIYCLSGKKWNDVNKPLGNITFNQFVKLTAELRNKFNFTDKICIATRLYAGANIPLGNSQESPLSEAFYAGGPNGMRAASPYAYGPGNFYSEKYNQNFFHAGDVKLEANFEFRFPIVWKLFGAAFVDAGNVWNWYSTADLFKAAGITDYIERLQLRSELYDGIINNPEFAKQIALGTGAGLRLDIDGLVVRLDVGVAIHAPYQTYRYDKDWKINYDAPIDTYFNIPSALDAIRINFGIGYPF